jgi:phage gp29-like protein
LLCQTYQNIVLDGQIQSAMLQRKMRVMASQFMLVDKVGETDEEKTKLLTQQWFYDFLELAMESIFWGYSLIEFQPIVNDEFKGVELVPRIYVQPELSIVKPTTASYTGVNYTEKPYSNWCIGVGKPKDLGLLMKCAPYAIWKNNAMGAWAEFAEVFGTPLRMGKTNVRDEDTRKNMENMMRNWGVASWAVFDTDDTVELLSNTRSDAFNVYDKMVERCNSEISKIILGQTGTTDEKSYSGSANVHENILKVVTKMDMIFMTNVVNNQLLPMMRNLGFQLDNLSFKFDETENISLIEQAKIDASFMPYYNFDKKYLEQKYNIVVEEKEVVEEEKSVSKIADKLKNLYS